MCSQADDYGPFIIDSDWLHVSAQLDRPRKPLYVNVVREVCGRFTENVGDFKVSAEAWCLMRELAKMIDGAIVSDLEISIPNKKG